MSSGVTRFTIGSAHEGGVGRGVEVGERVGDGDGLTMGEGEEVGIVAVGVGLGGGGDSPPQAAASSANTATASARRIAAMLPAPRFPAGRCRG